MGTESTNDKEPRFLFFVFSRKVRETKKMREREKLTSLRRKWRASRPASWIGRKSLSSKTEPRLCCCNKENNNGVGDGFRCGFGGGD